MSYYTYCRVMERNIYPSCVCLFYTLLITRHKQNCWRGILSTLCYIVLLRYDHEEQLQTCRGVRVYIRESRLKSEPKHISVEKINVVIVFDELFIVHKIVNKNKTELL